MDAITSPSTTDSHLGARSWTTRVIHLVLLLLVLHQLIGNQFMEDPLPGEPPSFVWILHEYLGMTALGVVGIFWVWTFVRRGETAVDRLLPWFSITRMRDVVSDAVAQGRRLTRGRAPDDKDGALASAVHGLGLLLITAMAGTGTLSFVTEGTPFAHDVLTLHKLMANLVYAYLVGHAGLAVLHHLLGSDIFSRMFWGGREQAAARASVTTST